MKKTKIVDYGKKKEFSVNTFKTKCYCMFPPKEFKYLNVESIDIVWSPTVTHLLLNEFLTITMTDSRASNGSKSSTELFTLRKSAANSWKLSLDTALYLPVSEIGRGVPLKFDISLPARGVKPNREIGKLKFVLTLASSGVSKTSSIKLKEFSYEAKQEYADDLIMIAGERVEETPRDAIDPRVLVSKYLGGSISVETLCKELKESPILITS